MAPVMSDAADPITLLDAVKFLAPLVGTGGLAAIAVAWIGSRKAPPPADRKHEASIGIQALLADHMAMDRLVNELRRLADAGEDMVRAANRLGDMMDISRALERLRGDERLRADKD
jgi:hypothetical protein